MVLVVQVVRLRVKVSESGRWCVQWALEVIVGAWGIAGSGAGACSCVESHRWCVGHRWEVAPLRAVALKVVVGALALLGVAPLRAVALKAHR